MALEHAILVSLRERPGSGYELARRFDKSMGYFWRATHQQIYRVLARMEESAWVRARRVAQDGRLDKKVYSVRPAGRAELRRWMGEPVDPPEFREDLLVKLRAAATADAAAAAAELRRHREQHAQRLAQYRQIEQHDFASPRGKAAAIHHALLRAGILYEQGWMQWCDEALRALR